MKKEKNTATVNVAEAKEENTMSTINVIANAVNENICNNNADFFRAVNSIALNVKGNMKNNNALYSFPVAEQVKQGESERVIKLEKYNVSDLVIRIDPATGVTLVCKQMEDCQVALTSVDAVPEEVETILAVRKVVFIDDRGNVCDQKGNTVFLFKDDTEDMLPELTQVAAPEEEVKEEEAPKQLRHFGLFDRQRAEKDAALKKEEAKKEEIKAKKAEVQEEISEVSEKKEPTIPAQKPQAAPATTPVSAAAAEFVVNDKTAKAAAQAMRQAYARGMRKMNLRIQVGTHIGADLQDFFVNVLPKLRKVCEITVADRDKTVAAYRKAVMRARFEAASAARQA